MNASLVAVIVLVLFDVILVLVLNPRINRRYAQQIWNDKIPLRDLNGTVIKIPVKYQDGEDAQGNPVIKTKEVIGPVWMTIAFGLGGFVGNQIKMSVMGTKSALSKKIDKGIFAAVKSGEMPREALLDLVPAKWQKYVAGAEIIGEILGGGNGGESNPSILPRTRGGGSFNPGLR